jgi:hypothetical protein
MLGFQWVLTAASGHLRTIGTTILGDRTWEYSRRKSIKADYWPSIFRS